MNYSNNGYAFFSAPKNGGTTLRAYITIANKNPLKKYKKGGYLSLPHVGATIPPQWKDYSILTNNPDKKSNKAFCIYRDPEARLVSTWKDKIIRKKSSIESVEGFVKELDHTWSVGKPPEKLRTAINIDKRHNKNGIIPRLLSRFQAEKTQTQYQSPEKKCAKNIYLLNHFMPQSFWWLAPQEMDFILDFENWSSIRKVWSALLEVELPDIHMRDSRALNLGRVVLPDAFKSLLEKIYEHEQEYACRARRGDEWMALLEDMARKKLAGSK